LNVLAFVLSERARFRTVGEHQMEGAVGRSESALAFTTCSLRLIGDLWDDGHRPISLSAAGGTSGIAVLDQRSPTRTLGAFVPSNSPFFEPFPDIGICS
jgi:hypothetical protein